MPFYTETPDSDLRLGDIVVGFKGVVPQIKKLAHGAPEAPWSLGVLARSFWVVMTPCCSIERGSVAIAPLGPIMQTLLKSQAFAADPTIINAKVEPRIAIPPARWDKMSEDERAQATDPQYVFLESFVYAPHPLLPAYSLNMPGGARSCNHYMVDFKAILRVECEEIDRSKSFPSGLKRLELGVQTRRLLREKLSMYFGRAAEEDLLLLR